MGQYNIEIKKLTAYGSFGSVEIIAMARNKYAISYVHNGIDEISFKMEAEPGAKVFIQGAYAENGISPSYPLNCGCNVFEFELISEDGKERRNVEAKVYRAFPSPVWKKVIDHAPWRPRDSAGELVFNDRIWLFGGYVPETVSEVWSTANGSEWKQHPDIPSPVGVDIPVVLNYKEKMFVFDVGGVLYSSKDGDNWEIVSANSPFLGRRHMGGVVFKDKMWVMGGVKGDDLFNDVWSSEDGVNWTLETEHAPWSKRMIHTTALVKQDMGHGRLSFRTGKPPFRRHLVFLRRS